MNNYYFTFGQKYRDGKHPNFPDAHGWVRISAISWDAARKKSEELFGKNQRGDLMFAFQYNEDDFRKSLHPLGEIASFEVQ